MSNKGKELYEFGPFRLDPEKRVLLRDHEPVPLQMKAFETLLALVRHGDEVVLKDELMRAVWPDTFVEESNLTQNISVLRKTLGDDTNERRYIVTIPGRGYRFVEKIRTVPEEEILVVESRSRSKVTITEELVGQPPLAGGGGQLALPGETASTRRWRWIVAIAIAATALVSFALYAFLSPVPMPRLQRSVRLTHTGRVSPYSVVLADGNRLYFTETSGANSALAYVPASGGEPTPIATSLRSISLHDIDAGRSRVLIAPLAASPPEPLWMMSTAGGSAQRLGDIEAADSAWSPDGQHIAYCREGSIYMAAADGSQSRKLLSVPGLIETLRWSPDGRLLRFTVNEPSDGHRSLWEASADGTNPHPMALGWKDFAHHWGEGEYAGDWTPDGKYFVFHSERFTAQSFWAIREKPGWMRPRDTTPVQIYTSPDRLGEPRFSADGKKIYFVGYREERELVRYDNARQLFVPYLGGIPARLLSFSPDGQWVAWKSDIDATLWRSRVDRSERIQLTFPPLFVLHSSWSPDGKTIVFQGVPPGEPAKIYTITASGGTPEVLLQDDAVRFAAPSWCGDGSAILSIRWSKNNSGELSPSVLRLDMNTRQTRVLPASEGFDGIHCSPDGKHAAASDEHNHKLMLFDFAADRWSVLSDGAAYGWGIRWSADSQFVYYQHADEEEQPIFRVRISDRKVEQITSSRQILRADVLSYTMTGLTPDNAPLASIVHRTSDVYALELDVP